MSSDAPDIDATVNAATLCATVMIAQHIGGKATRDAVFLSSFDVTSLPAMIIGAAALSIGVALGATRLFRRFGPGRVAPLGFFFSAMLWLLWWGVFQLHPGVAAVLVFLHMAAVAATLISGFWSMASERFDPHTAKKKMARIALGANVGGLLGGLTAERVAATLGVDMMLPIMAGMHLFCAWRVRALRLPEGEQPPQPKTDDEKPDNEGHSSGLQVLARMPYLRNLAILLFVGTVATGLIDYVFKAQAAAAYPDGDDLGRFFAIFYTALSAATLAVQALVTGPALEKLGLARTIAAAPVSVVALGISFVALPGLVLAAALAGLDRILRNSLFRSAYEVLFTPVPRDDKRATKTIIDVGFERVGDAVGGGLVAVILLAGPVVAGYLLVGVAVALAIVATVMSFRLHRGYVQTLEQSLLTQARDLDLEDIRDSTTRSMMLQTFGTLDVRAVLADGYARTLPAAGIDAATVAPSAAFGDWSTGATAPASEDPVLTRLAGLRSKDPARVQVAVDGRLPPALVPDAIRALADDDVHVAVSKALRTIAPSITGQLADVLLDSDEDFAVRRRIPRVIAFGASERAWASLLDGLADRRFEVRFQCGRALLQMRRRDEERGVDGDLLEGVILKELKVSRRVWDGQRLLDSWSEESLLLEGVLEERSSRSLEHIFTLLSLVLPPKPVKVAFRGLQTDDALLRGTALEYLETTLSEPIRVALWPFVTEESAPSKAPPPEQGEASSSLDKLLKSQRSIEMNLEELRQRLGVAETS